MHLPQFFLSIFSRSRFIFLSGKRLSLIYIREVLLQSSFGVDAHHLSALPQHRRLTPPARDGRSRPEIRTLARALAIEDGARRKEFLQHTFTKLEELDEFVKFVQEGIEYLGDDFGFAVRTNMPQDHFDKMKAIYAEATALRRKYLQ